MYIYIYIYIYKYIYIYIYIYITKNICNKKFTFPLFHSKLIYSCANLFFRLRHYYDYYALFGDTWWQNRYHFFENARFENALLFLIDTGSAEKATAIVAVDNIPNNPDN